MAGKHEIDVYVDMVPLGKRTALYSIFGGIVGGGAGAFLAKVLVSGSGSVGASIDPACGANPDCVNLVIETVKVLPLIFPTAFAAIGGVITGVALRKDGNSVSGVEASVN